MKKYIVGFVAACLLLFGFSGLLFAGKYPRPTGWVSDFAGVIDPVFKDKISNIIAELEKKTASEISVVTIKSLEGEPVENVSKKIFENWGIGKKSKDNGILILAAVEDRKVRIEVGYGLEGTLPDGLVGSILDTYVLPEFKKNDYGKGLMLGTMAVAFTIAKEQGIELTGSDINSRALERQKPTLLGTLLKLAFFILLAILFINNPMLFLLFLGMGGGRGGSGGGFGGGFGGFGGGMSGGGGSSRSW